MPRVSDVFAGFERLSRKPDDSDFTTSCPACHRMMRVDRAAFDDSDPFECVYSCPRKRCGQRMLIVSTPGVVPWEGRGYRLGDWVVRNPEDLLFFPPGGANVVKIPGSPNALA